jgi:hypothetical protein
MQLAGKTNYRKRRLGWPGVAWLATAVVLRLAGGVAAANAQALEAREPPGHGGILYGSVTVGSTPRAGITVTVTNPVTGSRSTTTTDGSGAYSVRIAQNGQVFIRAEAAGISAATKKVVLSPSGREQQVNFSLEEELARPSASLAGTRNLASVWQPTELPPVTTSGIGFNTNVQLQTSNSVNTTGVSIPSFPGDLYFSDDSFNVNGQGESTIPYLEGTGLMDNYFENGPELQDPSQYAAATGNFFGNGPSGGGFSALVGGSNPNRPHGMVFWTGGNSALNARPYVLVGQPSPNPSYSSNNYGLVLLGRPFIPGLTKPSTKDFFLVTYSGQLSSSVVNQYGVVPTTLEREGNFSGLKGPTGAPVLIYPPTETTVPYPNNTINTPLDPVAQEMLKYLPAPNVDGNTLNYHLLTTQGTHANTLGLRYNRNFGATAGSAGQFTNRSNGLNQSVSFNFNLSHQATDVVNLFPQLGGRQLTDGHALTALYTLGKGAFISNFAFTSNHSDFEMLNYFTNTEDISSEVGFIGPPKTPPVPNPPLNHNRFNYGLPNMIFSGFSTFAQTQPASIVTEALALGNNSAWVHGSHDVRFGGDLRRIQLNLFGGANATGTLAFTGKFTQALGPGNNDLIAASGSSFADFLVGLPQLATIESPKQFANTRQNDWSAFIRDDWRVLPNLTILGGLRYVYFSPFAEEKDRLAALDYNADFSLVAPVRPNGIGRFSGAKYPRTLIYPERNNFSPHLGFAWQAAKGTTVRAGYGIHYTVGQYGSFIQYLAYQPPFADVQTNQNFLLAGTVNGKPFVVPFYTTGNALDETKADPNYAVNRYYRVPYIQLWLAEVEQELPLQIVLDVSYTGAKGTRLDNLTTPGVSNTGGIAALYFDFEDSTAFSNYNALSVTATKRLQNGLSLAATYTYSHAIDNASSINAGLPVVAQNPENLLAEEGNSSFDIRNQVYGSFLYELPFGPNMSYLSSGNWVSHALGDWSLAGTFTVASGLPLTPYVEAAAAEVERGTHASVRPNRNFGVPISAGGGHAGHWFNTAAFSTHFAPGQLYGTASRNSIPGPGLINVSLSLSKMFLFREGDSLEFRAAATNAFNAVQYGTVNTQFDSPTVGQVTSTQPMRQITFLGRFRF